MPSLLPTAATTRMLCLRHGQSLDNASLVCSSRPPGAELTPLGRSQAQAALEALRDEPIAAVYASSADRATQTAGVLADDLGLPVRVDARLLEYEIGEYEGATEPAAHERTYEVLHSWIVGGDLDTRLPGGESGREVMARFGAVMEDIATGHPGATVAVVGHVGTFTLGLLSLCMNLSAQHVWGRPLPHACPVQVVHDAAGWRCEAWPGVPG